MWEESLRSAPSPADTGGLGKQLPHRGPPGRRWALAEEYRQTAAAAARLRLSARPWIGTRTRASAASASSGGNPCASEPNSHAVGWCSGARDRDRRGRRRRRRTRSGRRRGSPRRPRADRRNAPRPHGTGCRRTPGRPCRCRGRRLPRRTRRRPHRPRRRCAGRCPRCPGPGCRREPPPGAAAGRAPPRAGRPPWSRRRPNPAGCTVSPRAASASSVTGEIRAPLSAASPTISGYFPAPSAVTNSSTTARHRLAYGLGAFGEEPSGGGRAHDVVAAAAQQRPGACAWCTARPRVVCAW